MLIANTPVVVVSEAVVIASVVGAIAVIGGVSVGAAVGVEVFGLCAKSARWNLLNLMPMYCNFFRSSFLLRRYS